MSRASRSDTPERALRAPPSPLSVSSVSPPAPPCEGGDRTPPNPASADDECCCVCLERLQPAAVADQLPVPFPTCRRHRAWAACHSIVRKPVPPATSCARSVAMVAAQIAHPQAGRGQMMPRCARSANTTAYQCRSASPASPRCARRSVTTPSVRSRPTMLPSPAHPGVALLCCHHVAAVSGATGEFVRLPHREMNWAPVPDPTRRRHSCLAPRLGGSARLEAVYPCAPHAALPVSQRVAHPASRARSARRAVSGRSMDRTPARSRRRACAPRPACSRWNRRRRSGPPRDCTRPPRGALFGLLARSPLSRSRPARPIHLPNFATRRGDRPCPVRAPC